MNDMNFEQARFNMVEQQVRTWDVLNPLVLDVIHTVPREAFVPEEFRKLAYADTAIPLNAEQKMMKPVIEGRLLQGLDVQPEDKILEVGTGSGYLTAVLSKLGCHVYSVEIDPELKAAAEKKLAANNITNITLDVGDAADGWDKYGPYDAIAITASLPEVPESFKKSLAIEGRLFAVVGDAPAMKGILLTRTGENEWIEESLFETDLPRLTNIVEKKPFLL